MPKENDDIADFFGEPISVYTSLQAEDDGILIQTGNAIINYMTRTGYDKASKHLLLMAYGSSSLKVK
jgi:hypothetical protein